MTLNVLLVENEPGVAAIAEQELRNAGHHVLLCHDVGTASFPCRGVVQPSTCPMRSHAVDVALVVRAGTRAQPTLGEDGARCALTHCVPLVVAGAPLFDPFDEYATRTIDRTYDVVDACEQAAAGPVAALGERLAALLDEIAPSSAGGPTVTAEVTRRVGRLMVNVRDGGLLTKVERSRVAVRITMVVRELDPYAAGIDVAFQQ